MNLANAVCEASPICENFQSAICLHCNLRLCIKHVTEHNHDIFSSVKNLNKEVESVVKQINDEYENSRETYNNILSSLLQWRIQQIDNIQHIYEHCLQDVECQQEAINVLHQQLTNKLNNDVRHGLNQIECQKSSILKQLNSIRRTIRNVQEDSIKLKWNVPLLQPEFYFEQYSAHSIRVGNKGKATTSNFLEIPPKRRRKITVSSNKFINLGKYRSYRRLVELFSNTSSIAETKAAVANYLLLQGPRFQVPVIVSSYLTAWHRKPEVDEKTIILNEHLSIVKDHIGNTHQGYAILLGLYAFFYNESIRENKRDMMAFLLKFFVNHECISQRQILNWHNNIELQFNLGLDGAQLLMMPYIESLYNNKTVTNPISIPTVHSMIEPSNTIEIKQEPKDASEIKQEPKDPSVTQQEQFMFT